MSFYDDDKIYCIILVIGLTGSGKSYFINHLIASSVKEGHSMASEAEKCQIIWLGIGAENAAIVDTPGFDDSNRSYSETLKEINQMSERKVGLKRERELRKQYWNVMESKRSIIRQFDGKPASAKALVCRLTRKPDVVFDIQTELVHEGKMLEEITAGRLVVPRLDSRIVESNNEIQKLEQRI
ncbi:hypothetical protein DM02DRAFT_659210 [Periconia macrospinosa]|uniref:G domain-containing protein n=1 Tax=Periconia macrospinosa TaxID=97972 RepID=A0A2V1DEH3_9PLEO|nr:hypothetical protein DM02DRAFT_659210 [Periconia macrospinosa]